MINWVIGMNKSSLFLVKKFRVKSSKSLIYELLNILNMEKFKRELVEETKVINKELNDMFDKFSQINTEEELKELLIEGETLRKKILNQSKKLMEQNPSKSDEYIIRFNLTGLVDSAKMEKFMDIDFEGIKEELGY